MTRINERELVNKLSETTGYPRIMVDVVITTLKSLILSETRKGSKILLSGFGLFETVKGKRTRVSVIHTNEIINVKPKLRLKFTQSALLRRK